MVEEVKVKAKKKRSSYKFVQRETTVAAALEDGKSELEELYNEMNEWADNMDSGGLGHTDKHAFVRECADQLQEAESVSVPDLPAEIGELVVFVGQQEIRSKKRGPSRAIRCANACSLIRAGSEAVATFYEDALDEQGEKLEKPYEMDELDTLLDNAEGVDFPGMYA